MTLTHARTHARTHAHACICAHTVCRFYDAAPACWNKSRTCTYQRPGSLHGTVGAQSALADEVPLSGKSRPRVLVQKQANQRFIRKPLPPIGLFLNKPSHPTRCRKLHLPLQND